MSSFTEVKWNVTFEGTILDWHIELFSLVIFNYFEHNTCMFITVKGTRDFKMLGALIPARYWFGKLQIVFDANLGQFNVTDNCVIGIFTCEFGDIIVIIFFIHGG